MNLIEDLSKLTTIQPSVLRRLADKSIGSISYTVEENLLHCNNITSIDIGIGTLNILVDDAAIRYKFIPSKQLENSIKVTVDTGKCPMTREIETAIKDKINSAYKDLF